MKKLRTQYVPVKVYHITLLLSSSWALQMLWSPGIHYVTL